MAIQCICCWKNSPSNEKQTPFSYFMKAILVIMGLGTLFAFVANMTFFPVWQSKYAFMLLVPANLFLFLGGFLRHLAPIQSNNLSSVNPLEINKQTSTSKRTPSSDFGNSDLSLLQINTATIQTLSGPSDDPQAPINKRVEVQNILTLDAINEQTTPKSKDRELKSDHLEIQTGPYSSSSVKIEKDNLASLSVPPKDNETNPDQAVIDAQAETILPNSNNPPNPTVHHTSLNSPPQPSIDTHQTTPSGNVSNAPPLQNGPPITDASQIKVPTPLPNTESIKRYTPSLHFPRTEMEYYMKSLRELYTEDPSQIRWMSYPEGPDHTRLLRMDEIGVTTFSVLTSTLKDGLPDPAKDRVWYKVMTGGTKPKIWVVPTD